MVMKKKEEKPDDDFIAYENARIEKDSDEVEDVSDKNVESVNEIINPDENSMDSRG